MKKSNKTFKRSVALVLCFAILAAIGIGAYLTDSDVKSDVYTVGNVQAEIVSNGDMELDNVGALLPGTVHAYERAATNTGINDAYVFMSLTIPYEMVGVSDTDGTQIGERVRQLFIPGVNGGYIGSEWKLVDVGYIGQYEIEDNGQYCGEHDKYSAVVGDTITYVYGYIGDNADGSLKALASGETTSNLVETMELTNLYNASKITGEVSTKLYAIQSGNVNGGLTDVNGVWAVINKAISGEQVASSTLTYSIKNTTTGETVGYAPLKLVDENGNVIATSVANEEGNGQFQNVPAGNYAVETKVGNLSITSATGYSMRGYAGSAAIVITGEDSTVEFGLTMPTNTLVQGTLFNDKIPDNVTSIEFVAMPQTYSLADRTVPAGAIDVSEAADGSVMAWVEGTTFYVVALDGGVIYANPNCTMMFANKPNLTYIGTENLNTSAVYNAMGMFYACSNLTNDITDFDLSNAGSLYYTYAECNWVTEAIIPDGTTEILDGTYDSCYNLTSVYIPASVEVIGEEAFGMCEKLSTITFEENSQLKVVKYSAFRDCDALTTFTFPDGVETIEGGVFFQCKNLETINIPASVTSIGNNNIVRSCTKLTTINVDPANENYISVDGVLFTKDMKTLMVYPAGKSDVTEYIVPTGVETIEQTAFYACSNLTTVVIPEGVTNIKTMAFTGCSNLENITIPSTVTTIGLDAFSGTKWLQNQRAMGGMVVVNGIIIDASNVTGDVVLPDGMTSIPDGMFQANQDITSVHIPASVTSIGNMAFYQCGNLTTVTFEEGSQLKTVGRYAFRECLNLTTIVLPDGVETIDMGSFQMCESLTSINIPNSVKAIYNTAFQMSGITEIFIPASVEALGRTALADCYSLTAINVDPANINYASVDGVLFSKDMKTLIQYPNGNTNTSYIVPEGVEEIGADAIAFNWNLTKITIPTSVIKIGSCAFIYDDNLVTINYCGTQAQWNLIEFGELWNDSVHADFHVVYNYIAE